MTTLDARRYPIGPISLPERRDEAKLREFAQALRQNAREAERTFQGLSDEQLGATYRPGSFTVRQLAHHLADAHEQGFMRFRWGLTEEGPTILPMNEERWAELPDYTLAPEVSLAVFQGVNARWTVLLEALDPQALSRTIRHPQEGDQDLWRLLAKHEWHVRHHLAHARLALLGG